MGRKSRNHRNYKAIIVFTKNIKKVIELDNDERIKNLDDLARLPKLPRKYNRKIKKTPKIIEANILQKKKSNNESINDAKLLSNDFYDKNKLEDFSFDDKSLKELDTELQHIFYCIQ